MENLDKQNNLLKLNFQFFAYASFALVMMKISFGLDWSWATVLTPVFLMMAPVGVAMVLLTLFLLAIGLQVVFLFITDCFGRD